jgi:hypothetical protein
MRIASLFLSFLLISSSLFVFPVTAQDDCPPSQFTEWGAIGVVTPGDANNLRAEPSTTAEVIGRVPPGEPFKVMMEAETCAEGFLWREIQTATLRGWTVEIRVDGDEPFIVPYVVPEPREVGIRQDDGSIVVDEDGVRFVIPAALNVVRVLVILEVGLFGNVMSAQPSSVTYSLDYGDGDLIPWMEIYPYAISDATVGYWENNPLNTLLAERPSLTDPVIRRSLTQSPISGVAALFRGAPRYLLSAGMEGVRYISYFAQTSVLFGSENRFAYLYRGISADNQFFIAAEWEGVRIPAEAIPGNGSRDEDAYVIYLQELEANLDAQPNSAFTPDLTIYDAVMASLTITDPEALFRLIP